MLVAPKQFDYTYEPTLTMPKTMPKKTTSKRLRVKQKFGITLFIIIAFGIGIAFTSRVALFVYSGYEVSKLQREITTLQTANERLKLEIEQLSSLDRVERLALNQLGMVKPATEDYEFLPVNEELALASKSTSQESLAQPSNNAEEQAEKSLLAAWTKKLTSLFVGTVEASEL